MQSRTENIKSTILAELDGYKSHPVALTLFAFVLLAVTYQHSQIGKANRQIADLQSWKFDLRNGFFDAGILPPDTHPRDWHERTKENWDGFSFHSIPSGAMKALFRFSRSDNGKPRPTEYPEGLLLSAPTRLELLALQSQAIVSVFGSRELNVLVVADHWTDTLKLLYGSKTLPRSAQDDEVSQFVEAVEDMADRQGWGDWLKVEKVYEESY